LKIFLAIVFLLIYNAGFSRHYFGLQFGANFPINYTTDELSRKVGLEPGFLYGKNIGTKFIFETGLVIDIWGRINHEVVNHYHDEEGVYIEYLEDAAFLRFAMQVPLLLKYKLNNDKFQISSGFNLSGRNLLTFTNYTGIDPEHGRPVNSNEYLAARGYGVDFDLGVDYFLNQEVILYLNYRTALLYNPSTNYDYGLLSAGIKYHFGRMD
jgi:hypothetical protein